MSAQCVIFLAVFMGVGTVKTPVAENVLATTSPPQVERIFSTTPPPIKYCSPHFKCSLQWKWQWLDKSDEKESIKFEKDGKEFTDGKYIRNDTVVFEKPSQLIEGIYSTLFTKGNAVIRSPKVKLKILKENVSMLVFRQNTHTGENVLMECWPAMAWYNLHAHSIMWYKNSQLLQSKKLDDDKLFLKSATLADEGSYSCGVRLTENDPEVMSEPVKLTTTQDLNAKHTEILYFSKSRTLEAGSPFTIYCLASGANNIHIGKRTGMKVLSQTSSNFSSYTFSAFRKEDVGDYFCTVVGHQMITNYTQLNLGVAPQSHKAATVETLKTHIGHDVRMSCNPDVGTLFNITWWKNAERIQQSQQFFTNRNSLWKKHVREEDAGFYQCTIENDYGSYSQYFEIELNPPDLGVKNLTVVEISEKEISLKWGEPANPYRVLYVYTWTNPLLEGRPIVREDSTHLLHATIRHDVFGGLSYRIAVCLYYPNQSKLSDCVYVFATTPDGPPKMGPILTVAESKIPCRKLCVELSWENPIWHTNGQVKEFLLHKLTVVNSTGHGAFDHDTQTLNRNAHPLVTEISDNLVKVWITSVTSMGEGPMSNSFLLSNSPRWKKDIYKRNVSVKWDLPFDRSERNALLTWDHSHFYLQNESVVGWVVHYMQLPYNKLTSVKQLNKKTASSIRIKNLTNTTPHRFSVSAILRENYLYNVLSPASHVVLWRHNNRQLTRLFQNSLQCVSVDTTGILISWSSTILSVTSYEVRLYSERTGKADVYQVPTHYLHVRNLPPNSMFAVQVLPQHPNITYSPTQHISCNTQLQVPSAVRGIDYYTVTSDKKNHIHVNWKEPKSVGDGVFHYLMRIKIASTNAFPFDPYGSSVVMDEISDRVHSHRIIMNTNQYANITIRAVNGAGQGVPVSIVTKALTKATSSPQTAATPTPPDSDNLNTGVVIGMSVAAFFLFILLIVFIVKNPFRSSPRNYSQPATNEEFLYLQRLDELNSASSSAACRGCGGVCTANLCAIEDTESPITKLMRPIRRLFYHGREPPISAQQENPLLHSHSASSAPVSARDTASTSQQYSISTNVSIQKNGDTSYSRSSSSLRHNNTQTRLATEVL